MLKSEFQFGDILATRSNSFLSRGIRWMLKWYKSYAADYSHNAVVINMWGDLWIAEALAWGVRIWPIEESGYIGNPNVMILRDKRGFTKKQIDTMSKKMASFGGVRYQYENLPMWIAKILAHKNWFKSSNEKSVYCSELAAIAINSVYPNTFKTPNMTNPADLLSSSVFNKIK